MPLQPGLRLGPYEIIAALGAGGMGEVYKPRDTRLHRDLKPANVMLTVVPFEDNSTRNIQVVLNWAAGLKKQ